MAPRDLETTMKSVSALALALASLFAAAPASRVESGLQKALADARAKLEAGDLVATLAAIERALERDPNSLAAWELRERWAAQKGDKDEEIHALHRQLSLARTQKLDKALQDAVKARLLPLDPAANELTKIRTNFVDKLVKLGEGYVKAKRPHSAIRAFKQAVALDPDRADLRLRIEEIAAAPDPTLAEDARPKDLLEGISEEWIAEHDAEHATWDKRAKLERPNYITYTDAGYEVLVRAGEAMEQMNGFYRQFFRYGTEDDGRAVSRIELWIFKDRDEYLKLGSSPVEWSGGQFTGSTVETFITASGFEDTVGTLFHEAAHQFVSLATNAAGWLNEGMASFFEGARILANGTVIMNLPANGRLFPLAGRMEKGWMSGADDGLDPEKPEQEPATSPTFRIVLEDEYEWGPAWYAPTWGVVYFLYNYQDRTDGRFIYRKAFGDFINASGGKSGDSAIATFEEVVLGNPEPATEGSASAVRLPKTIDELNDVWKQYILDLRDRQSGRIKDTSPYLEWARMALKRKASDTAAEHFERALAIAPNDVTVLSEFAEFLATQKKDDRATKLLMLGLAILENTEPVDLKRVDQLDRRLRKLDPSYQRVLDVRSAMVDEIVKHVERYLAAGLNLQAMELSYQLGAELGEPRLFKSFERAVQAEGRSLALWRLAYNEVDLDGWSATGLEEIFEPSGEWLLAHKGKYKASDTTFSMLALDTLTSGDYSLECELEAAAGEVTFAGLVFGRKSAGDCHALILFPPSQESNGSAHLTTFYGTSSYEPLRNVPVQHPDGMVAAAPDRTTTGVGKSATYKLRLEVTGRAVDVYVNGEFQTTHEFANLEVLRGSFGLITGVGKARFKNIRFLARHPRDPSAAIERKLLRTKSGAASGVSSNGSYLGRVPPFPSVQRWLQGEHQSWQELRGAPTLVTLLSVEQNEEIAVDAFLRDLAEKQAGIGLAFVTLVGHWNDSRIGEYLARHPLPGAVALDSPAQAERNAVRDSKTGNIGHTFEEYGIARFFLPRMLLLDLDGTVVWEGEPGFQKGKPWRGEETLLDVPLRELIEKRKLAELGAWRAAWPAARASLERGAFALGVEALKKSADFEAPGVPELEEALAALRALQGAITDGEGLAARLVESGREPALEVLIDWSESLGTPLKKTKSIQAVLKNANASAWGRLPAILKPVPAKLAKDPTIYTSACEKLAELPGTFAAEAAARAKELGPDSAALTGLLEELPLWPARWLAQEIFHW
jgi:tetratricopeptide (TPR) repeat protein